MARMSGGFRNGTIFHEVWEWNLEEEVSALLAAVFSSEVAGAVIAIDTEFPGFLLQAPRSANRATRHQVLRTNVDRLWPIQLGMAVANSNGAILGVWSFNLRFDINVDQHTSESIEFLRAAGLDFGRHQHEGICVAELGRLLGASGLVGGHCRGPLWLTFSGSYDFGYIMKILTLGRPLPVNPDAFDRVLSYLCPWRRELKDFLPFGSLESLGRAYGVRRRGVAHTAGSDALLTLELYLRLGGDNRTPFMAPFTDIDFDKFGSWPVRDNSANVELDSGLESIWWPDSIGWHIPFVAQRLFFGANAHANAAAALSSLAPPTR